MPLAIGGRIGPYEVLSPLGAGGMGEVYRAHDAKLRREVALKVLPAAWSADPDRRARFTREAHVLASLNHPNIASIYGIEEADGVTALVLELVEGPTLADRIASGPLPPAEALRIANDIANALDAAHEKGIVHRDLKPANVKIADDGRVKVLDFGLAKALDPSSASASAAVDPALSPTMSVHATVAGVILGTAAYMSPEQAKGKSVDKRTDIWAFGCVLFEMLAGRRAFDGEDVTDFIVSIMTKEPDWKALPAATPPPIVELLQRCLKKDPRERLRDIADARTWLTGDRVAPSQVKTAGGQRVTAGVAIGLVAGAAIAWLGLSVLGSPQAQSAGPVTRLSMTLPAIEPLSVHYYPGSSLATSPDGNEVVYATRPGADRLRRRGLGDRNVQTIAGTERAQQPIYSPDGRWIAFLTDDGFLKKFPAQGGRPIVVLKDLRSAAWTTPSWSDKGQIVIDNFNYGLEVLNDDGNNRKPLLLPVGDECLLMPDVLPGSRTVLFTTSINNTYRIDAVDIDGTNRRQVLERASTARYLRSGHLLFVREGDVMVAPFDPEAVRVTGPAVSLGLDIVMDLTNNGFPVPQMAVSRSGTLVYAIPGKDWSRERTLDWVDRAGRTLESFTVPFALPYFALSPNGATLALMGRRAGIARILTYDLAGRSFTDVADVSVDYPTMPVWGSDGRSLTFAAGAINQLEFRANRVPSGGNVQVILKTKGSFGAPAAAMADGSLLYMLGDPMTSVTDIHLLDKDATGQPRDRILFGSPAFNETNPVVSPNGRWIAYNSDESGTTEVYLRRFPGGESKIKVSANYGSCPQWSPEGRELFYASPGPTSTAMFKVDFDESARTMVGAPQLLFERQFVDGIDVGRTWTVSRDGKKFLLLRGDRVMGASHELGIVQNWFDELRRLAPRSK